MENITSLVDRLLMDGQMTKEGIHETMLNILGAADETSSTLYCYTMCMLGVYQDVQERVFQEQKCIFQDDPHREVSWEDLQKMTYTEQVTRMLCFFLATAILVLFLVMIHIQQQRGLDRQRVLARSIPGPTPLPLIGNLLLLAGKDLVQAFRVVSQLTAIHGHTFRIWVGNELFVIVSDPIAIENILGNTKFVTRPSKILKLAQPFFRNGLLTSEGSTWRKQRKKIAHAFHNSIMEGFIDNLSNNSLILVDKLARFAESGETFDIMHFIDLCSMDIICEAALGYKLNIQTQDDTELQRKFLRALKLMGERTKEPHYYFDCIFYRSSLGKEQLDILGQLHGRIRAAVLESLPTAGSGNSILDLLVSGGDMTPEELVDEMISIIGAGGETVATTFCFVLAVLGQHPYVQTKLLQEQHAILGKDDLQKPFCFQDFSQMLYLDQVIKEVMRLFPPVPSMFRRVPEETDLKNGYILPEGSNVIVSTFCTHRNSKYFPNPRKFDPDRFLPQTSEERHPYCYFPFGAGRRACVGYRFAMLELKTMLSTFLRRYIVTHSDLDTMENNLELGLVMRPATGVNIQIAPRDIIN